MLAELGGERITRLGIGDELCGQEQSFYEWSATVFEQACEVFCLTDELDMNVVTRMAAQKPLQWCKENVLLDDDEDGENPDDDNQLNNDLKESKRIQQALSKLSNNKKID
ncbi:hypothetical protein BLA29_008094 [Euroglyphus maynei]|uniref:nitric-oxide synthase (NADPH) n=1 Tax=Euroglyphus maynei TaxID=6958 RepID=A0A1Y3BSC8_EURMA|nr:hypothetical protein BLA29_008094 [Euroglyphus maynei]